jgi:hypothetical protein
MPKKSTARRALWSLRRGAVRRLANTLSRDGRVDLCIDATFLTPLGKGAARYAYEVLRAMYAIRPTANVVVFATAAAARAVREACPTWNIHVVSVASMTVWHLLQLPCLRRALRCRMLHVLGEATVGPGASPYTMAVHELPQLARKLAPSRHMTARQWMAAPLLDHLRRRASFQSTCALRKYGRRPRT